MVDGDDTYLQRKIKVKIFVGLKTLVWKIRLKIKEVKTKSLLIQTWVGGQLFNKINYTSLKWGYFLMFVKLAAGTTKEILLNGRKYAEEYSG